MPPRFFLRYATLIITPPTPLDCHVILFRGAPRYKILLLFTRYAFAIDAMPDYYYAEMLRVTPMMMP